MVSIDQLNLENRRQSPRWRIRGMLDGKIFRKDSEVAFRPFDISQKGLGIWSDTSLQIGEELVFKAHTANPNSSIKLRVQWVSDNFANTNLSRIGLQVVEGALNFIPDDSEKHSIEASSIEPTEHPHELTTLGGLTRDLVHDINNSLGIVLGQIEMLRNNLVAGKKTSSEAIRDAESILVSSTRVKKIADSIRIFTQGPNAKIFQKVRISDLFTDVQALWGKHLKNKKIDLRLELVPDDLIFECMPSEMFRLLLNLVTNAADAVANLDEKWIHLDAEDHEDHIELIVSDSGQGLKGDISKKLGQPFFTTKSGNTGLGIGIVSKIAAEHYGQFQLDTQAPTTRFIVTIPKKSPTKSTH